MSYTDSQFSQTMLAAIDLTSSGDQAVWAPTGLPIVPRRLAAVVTTATTTPNARVALDLRPTAGSDVGREAGRGGDVLIPASSPAGRVVYRELSTLALTILPGQELVINVPGAVSAGVCTLRLIYDVVSEIPANNARMLASA
jgi:hypothetical protein